MNSGWHIYLTIYYIPGTVLIARNTVENKNNQQKNPCPRGANSLDIVVASPYVCLPYWLVSPGLAKFQAHNG